MQHIDSFKNSTDMFGCVIPTVRLVVAGSETARHHSGIQQICGLLHVLILPDLADHYSNQVLRSERLAEFWAAMPDTSVRGPHEETRRATPEAKRRWSHLRSRGRWRH